MIIEKGFILNDRSVIFRVSLVEDTIEEKLIIFFKFKGDSKSTE